MTALMATALTATADGPAMTALTATADGPAMTAQPVEAPPT